jgi:hypothetical protein
MSNPDRRYKVTYSLAHHPDGLTGKQIRALSGDHGGCDAVLVISVMGEHGKPDPYSVGAMSIRGGTGKPMPSAELFALWSVMANALAEDPNLEPSRREYCAGIFAEITAAVFSARTTH